MPECSIDGCSNVAKYKATGWCQTHYHRYYRTGDPLGLKQEHGASGADTASWQGDEITYRTAHGRVQGIKGRASEHGCTACERQAEQWAYDHTDNNQKWATVNNRTVAYSTDPDRYQPMCRGCHIKLDRARGAGWPRPTHCIRGHEFTEENTYIRANGERNCRACTNDRARQSRARKILNA